MTVFGDNNIASNVYTSKHAGTDIKKTENVCSLKRYASNISPIPHAAISFLLQIVINIAINNSE